MAFPAEEPQGITDRLESLILEATRATAEALEDRIEEGNPGPAMVTKAVIIFEYLDNEGLPAAGYRRVNCQWHDVDGFAAILTHASRTAWLIDHDVIDR